MKSKLDTIMLIDDNSTASFIHKTIIEHSEITNDVKIIGSAKEGLTLLTTNNEYKKKGGNYWFPELIFLDVMMPSMNGWQFLDKMKELLFEQIGKIKVVMLTSSLNPNDSINAKTNPFVFDIVPKPLTEKSINAIIQKHFGNEKLAVD